MSGGGGLGELTSFGTLDRLPDLASLSHELFRLACNVREFDEHACSSSRTSCAASFFLLLLVMVMGARDGPLDSVDASARAQGEVLVPRLMDSRAFDELGLLGGRVCERGVYRDQPCLWRVMRGVCVDARRAAGRGNKLGKERIDETRLFNDVSQQLVAKRWLLLTGRGLGNIKKGRRAAESEGSAA